MNESISRAAGATHGQEVMPEDMVSNIHAGGLRAIQRNTSYDMVKDYGSAPAMEKRIAIQGVA